MASLYMIFIVLMLASTKSLGELLPSSKTRYFILEQYQLKLECVVKNETKPLIWQKGTTEISKADGFEMSFTTESDGKKKYTLKKAKATYEDSGKYTCIVDNPQASATFTVNVFNVITHDIVIVSKEPAMIKCELQHLDKSYVKDFYWTKNYTMLSEVSEPKTKYKEDKANYTLEITKPRRRDAGLYNCVFKIDDQDFSIDVNMNMAPWIESMEKSRNLVQGDKLHLECNVQSHPFSSVIWKKDNETLKKDATNRVFLNENRTLIIFDLQFSDKGDYTCVATNSVNSTSMPVLVRVKDKLAALWPFLGIVAEVVILCIIIFICEKRRSKDMEDEYDNAGQPNVPNSKEHKGKDDVRQRNVRT